MKKTSNKNIIHVERLKHFEVKNKSKIETILICVNCVKIH